VNKPCIGLTLFALLAANVYAQTQQRLAPANTAIVLVGHGTPAQDFPSEKVRRLMQLDRQIHAAGGEEKAPADLVQQYRTLEQECRKHPRTAENDPYDAAVKVIAQELRQMTGYPVFVAHNEFCGLDVPEAIDKAVSEGAKRVIVLSMMFTPGGGHSEHDIPEKIEKARQKHPKVEVVYAWPYQHRQLANLLMQQLRRFTQQAKNTTTR
jgi:sirohydrochlorin cobaltochelatase